MRSCTDCISIKRYDFSFFPPPRKKREENYLNVVIRGQYRLKMNPGKGLMKHTVFHKEKGGYFGLPCKTCQTRASVCLSLENETNNVLTIVLCITG